MKTDRWINRDSASMSGVYEERLGANFGDEFHPQNSDDKANWIDEYTDHTDFTSYSPKKIDKAEYERDLAKRQREHIDNIRNRNEENWMPCAHNACTQCVGTGIKKDGTPCVHFLSCPCPKCSIRM